MNAPQPQTPADPVAAWLRAVLIFLLIVIVGLICSVRNVPRPQFDGASISGENFSSPEEEAFIPPEAIVQRIQSLETIVDQMRVTLFELSRGDQTEQLEQLRVYREIMLGADEELNMWKARLAEYERSQREQAR